MDINKCAEKILEKNMESYKQATYVSSRRLRHMIKNCIGGGQNGCRVAVIGYPYDVDRFMKHLPRYCEIVEVIHAEPDEWVNRPGREFNNIELISKIAGLQIDKLIIVSEEMRYLLQMYLISENVSYKVIDIYDILRKRYGIEGLKTIAKSPLRGFVYDFLTQYTKIGQKIWTLDNTKYCDNYDAILVKRYNLQQAKEMEEKKYYLKELIIDYLKIRDFQSAFLYIDKYTDLFGTDNNIFIEIKQDFLDLFSQMKSQLHNRDKKDIIIFWCDALPYSDFKAWQFLKELEPKSLMFENAYTHIPYTHTTSQAMFVGIPYFEGKLYRKIEKDNMIEHGKTLELLKENQYSICELGHNYTHKKYQKSGYYRITSAYPPASMHLWEALALLLENRDEKKFIICHMDCELHNPYWNGESEKLRVDPGNFLTDITEFTVQRMESANYLEKQLLYYLDFLGENTCEIFMSDHGIGGPAYSEQRLHAFCFVKDKDILKGRYTDYFSYLNFYELIHYVLHPTENNFGKIFSDYVLIQNDHPYSEKYCREILNKFKKSENVPRVEWMGFRGIIMQGYKLVRFLGYKEIWFDDKDKEIRSEDIQNQNLVQFMRDHVGDEFPDIRSEEHYESTRRLYEALQIKF